MSGCSDWGLVIVENRNRVIASRKGARGAGDRRGRTALTEHQFHEISTARADAIGTESVDHLPRGGGRLSSIMSKRAGR